MPEHVESDEAITDCYDVMAELRPHVSRAEFLQKVRAMPLGGLTACLHP